MNIDLKTDLLKFLVPPSLFWSTLILSDNIFEQDMWIFFSSKQDPWIPFSIIFISTGFIISAIGALITYGVDKCNKSVWRTARGEKTFWEKISRKGDYFSKKIETKWHFYQLNLNSVLALLGVLPVIFYENRRNYEFIIFIIFVTVMMGIFILLTIINYKRAKKFGNMIASEVVKECKRIINKKYEN